MDPETLETEDFVTLRPDLKNMPFLAHPRIEPDGRIWNLGVSGKQAMVWRLAADGALEDAEVIALPRASYIHDFSATARHLVIVLQPWVHVRNVAPMSAGFDWTPEAGTQVLVVDKADLTQRRIYDLPPLGFFHVGDAWDEADGTIRFDLCAHKDMDFAARRPGGAERRAAGRRTRRAGHGRAVAERARAAGADRRRRRVSAQRPAPRRAGASLQPAHHGRARRRIRPQRWPSPTGRRAGRAPSTSAPAM